MAIISQAQIDQLETGLEQVLDRIEQALALEVYAEKIPIIGDELKTAFDQSRAALQTVTELKAKILEALNDFNNLQDYAEAEIESALNQILEAAGFGAQAVDAIVNGSDVSLNFSTDWSRSFEQSLETDLGLPGLNIQTAGTAQAVLDYNFDFTVGVDSSGFYLETNRGAPELALGIEVTAPQLTADATLGFLNFSATDQGSSMSGSFAVDLKDANADGKLRLTEMSSPGADVLDATFTGGADINIHLDGNMGTAVLPRISADLNVDWQFNQSLVDPGDSNASFGTAPSVALNNVAYDFGTFVDDFIKPILDQLDPILQPINQALAIFRTDIGFLKGLPEWQTLLDKAGGNVGGQDAADGKITLIDFVKIAQPNYNLTGAVQFIELVDDIVDWAAFLQGKDFGPDAYVLPDVYTIGSFTLPDIRLDSFELKTAVPTGTLLSGTSFSDFLSGLGGVYDEADSDGQTATNIFEEMFSGLSFAFPVLTSPMEMFKLLVGGSASLFELDLPALNLGFGPGFDEQGTPQGSLLDLLAVPVFPGVSITFEGAFEAAIDMAFGYDTRGLQQFLESGFTAFDSVFNGFFVSDQKEGDVDLPEVVLTAALQLGIEASIAVASMGGGGNIAGQILLNLRDGLNGLSDPNDGKVYFDEFVNALQDNPFSLFDASGRITAGFAAFASVAGYEVWRYNSPRTTLGSFSFSDYIAPLEGQQVPPPGLGDVIQSGLLALNIGDRASERDIANATDGDETLEIGGSSGSVTVLGFDRSQTFSSISGIQGNGGEGNDEILLSADLAVSATLTGGTGSDFLFGGSAADSIDGGEDRDYLEGRNGADTLMGGGGDDILTGGAGADILDGGSGFDIATYDSAASAVTVNLVTGSHSGDAAGDQFFGIEVIEGSNLSAAGDLLIGDAGNQIFLGLKGDDTLVGAGGNDVLLGGEGDDDLDSGTGSDEVIDGGFGTDLWRADLSAVAGAVLLSLQDTQADAVLLVNGTQLKGIERLHLLTGSGGDVISTAGFVLADTIGAGAGDDHVDFGLGQGDSADGGSGTDTLAVDYSSLSGSVVQGAGSFTVSGGTYSTFSGFERFDVTGSANASSNLTGGSLSDTLIGGAASDTLSGGAGADILRGGDGNDLYIVDNAGDVVEDDNGSGQGGLDRVQVNFNYSLAGLAGIEELELVGSGLSGTGNALDNWIIGTAGSDTLDGSAGADTLEGGVGDDLYVFDNDADRIVEHDGGGRDTIRIAPPDQDFDHITIDLSTGWGAHVEDIVGDTYNYGYTLTANDLDNYIELSDGYGDIFGLGGDDTIIGGGGYKVIDGGDGNDWLIGGNQGESAYGYNENDTLLGGAGNDTLASGTGGDSVDGGDGEDRIIIDYRGATSVSSWDNGGGNWTYHADIGTAGGALGSVTFRSIEHLTVFSSEGNDTLQAWDGDDSLVSGGGDDYLLSGAGIDTIDGGAGNDTWNADLTSIFTGVEIDLNDDVSILAEGRRVTGIEALQITTGAGNDRIVTLQDHHRDDIDAGAGDDTITVGGGNDSIDGGDGYDILIVDFSHLTGPFTAYPDSVHYEHPEWGSSVQLSFQGIEKLKVIGGSGDDWLSGGGDWWSGGATPQANELFGNGGDDNLEGGRGGDFLDGGTGMDILSGGDGNDTLDGGEGVQDMAYFGNDRVNYTITQDSDGSIRIRDDAGSGGEDIVRNVEWFQFGSVQYGLADILGSDEPGPEPTQNQAPVDIYYMYGGSVAENAHAGALVAELGALDFDLDDSHTFALLDDAQGRFALIDSLLVVADGTRLDYEQAQSHTVTVLATDRSGASIAKNLTITLRDIAKETVEGGSGEDAMKGGRSNDKIYGRFGDDKLWGGLGKDYLHGGQGYDAFIFDTRPNRKKNLDTIADFKVKYDSIYLDNKIFKKLGKKGDFDNPAKIKKKFFTIGDKAKDKNDYIIYDNKKGILYYDPNGSDPGKAVEIAKLSKKLKMKFHDFFVI